MSTTGPQLVLQHLKDYNDFTLQISGSAKQVVNAKTGDGDSLLKSLNVILKATQERKDTDFGSGYDDKDSHTIAEAFKEHTTAWSNAMKAVAEAGPSIKQKDASTARELYNVLNQCEDGFQTYTKNVSKALSDSASKEVEDVAEKSGKATKEAVESLQ